MDLFSYEKEIRNLWQKEKRYKISRDVLKEKSFLFTPSIHLEGNEVSPLDKMKLIDLDIYARYLRLNNHNVLFNAYLDNYNHDVEYILNKIKEDILDLDISILNDNIKMIPDESLIKYAQDIFLDMFKCGLITRKNDIIVFRRNRVYQEGEYLKEDGIYYDNNYRTLNNKKDFCYKLDLRNIKDIILRELEEFDYKYKDELFKQFGYFEGVKMNFNTTNGLNLSLSLEMPEYLYGISYIIINPNLFNMSSFFEEDYKILNDVSYLYSGFDIINPLNSYQIPVFLSFKHNEAIYYGIPSLSGEDEAFASAYNLPFLPIFDYVNDTRVLVNSGLLNGYTEEQAKQEIIDIIQDNKLGEKYQDLKLNNLIVSSVDDSIPIPLYLNNEETKTPLLYKKDTNKYYIGTDLVEKNVISSFLNKDFLYSLIYSYTRVNEQNDGFFGSKYMNLGPDYMDINLYVLGSHETKELYWTIIAKSILEFLYQENYKTKIKDIMVQNKCSPFDLKSSNLNRLSLILNREIKEEELNSIINSFANIEPNSSFDISIYKAKLENALWDHDYSTYYLVLKEIIDKIKDDSLNINNARRLLIYLYPILPSLASFIANKILNLKGDLEDYSWDL